MAFLRAIAIAIAIASPQCIVNFFNFSINMSQLQRPSRQPRLLRHPIPLLLLRSAEEEEAQQFERFYTVPLITEFLKTVIRFLSAPS